MRANLDGSNIEALIEDPVNHDPRGIALDLDRGKVYWIDSDTIQRADLDGENGEIIVRVREYYTDALNDIALDLDGSKLYWTDRSSIQRAAPWDARDQQGDAVATGVYFTRLYYPGGVETRRLLYFK